MVEWIVDEPEIPEGAPVVVRQMIECGGQRWLELADRLTVGETVEVLGFSLWRHLGAEYRSHARHLRCGILPDGSFDAEVCATRRVLIE